MSCRDTSALVSRSLDESLSWRDRVGIRAHLLVCSACRNFERQVLFLRKASARLAARHLQDAPPVDHPDQP